MNNGFDAQSIINRVRGEEESKSHNTSQGTSSTNESTKSLPQNKIKLATKGPFKIKPVNESLVQQDLDK
tara:strand:- start:417 stop:623 length:207 start_codon:yes stop_codon:yes gene_type:complete